MSALGLKAANGDPKKRASNKTTTEGWLAENHDRLMGKLVQVEFEVDEDQDLIISKTGYGIFKGSDQNTLIIQIKDDKAFPVELQMVTAIREISTESVTEVLNFIRRRIDFLSGYIPPTVMAEILNYWYSRISPATHEIVR